MTSTQQILSAITGMQENAQAALPVIPNNGNPGGAHNMPQMQGQEPAKPAGPDLSWLQPSAAMQGIVQSMQTKQPDLDRQLQTIRQQPVLPMGA